MRHLKKYNEALRDENGLSLISLVDKFINRLLEYKSDKIVNLQLSKSNPSDNDGWEVRPGYPNRKTITFDNKISNKQETINIENHSSRVRVFWDGNYRSDISIRDISGYDRGEDRAEKSINHIFNDIIKTSNDVSEYFRKMSIANETLGKLSEEIIEEHFHDIIDISRDYTITKRQEQSKHHYIDKWELSINLPSVYQKNRDGFSMTFNDNNTSLMESLTSASHRLKDDNIIICVHYHYQNILIVLHAMDENGYKI